MPVFKVELRTTVWITAEVVAEDEDTACDLALQRSQLQGYSGNGEMSGKLIGTSDRAVTISVSDDLEIDDAYQM